LNIPAILEPGILIRYKFLSSFMNIGRVCLVRLFPKMRVPDLEPKRFSLNDIKEKVAIKEKVSQEKIPFKKVPIRHMTQIKPPNCAVPLEHAQQSEDKGPFKFYEITLRRGLIGMPQSIRNILHSLGIKRRHQVVWQPISASCAGKILKVRALVHVRLTSQISPKIPVIQGYKVIGNMLNQ
jgi:large subunit ribosomal protein L30